MIYVFYISSFEGFSVFSHPVFNGALHFTNICFNAWTADHVFFVLQVMKLFMFLVSLVTGRMIFSGFCSI